ncbi:MAG: 16S rRNA (guanine(527)-N(7))-methyltransferase RsmG [candidate division Zixibacteria bacterium]|nr:16S rRNA (guanine(527)-N(7))-methyltransferase RsmG [candidate division Zixibacteria bacterium]
MELQYINQAQLKQLNDILEQSGVTASDKQLHQLDGYTGLLQKYTRSLSLVSQADINMIFERHIIDSLGVLQLLNIKDKPSFLDVGSGNGFPGIPMAIFLPGSEFTLLDSSEKKTAFLNIIKTNLNLVNINVQNTRVEKYIDGPHPRFNFLLCRAFKSLNECVSLLKPLIDKNSTLIYFNKRSGDLTDRYTVYPQK